MNPVYWLLVLYVAFVVLLWVLVYRIRRPARVADVWDQIDRNLAVIEANVVVIALNVGLGAIFTMSGLR
jgi:hypothetical protein